MAAVTNDTSNGSSAASSAVGSNGEVSHMFTTLLVAQIKNQNPLEPTDPSEFVNQLTQLSQMETLQQLNAQGASNASLLASLQMLTLGAQVGSTVQAQVGQLNLDKQPVQTHFNLDSNANPATLVLKGADGSEKRIDLGSLNLGSHSYTLDPVALGLTSGSYEVHVENESKQQTPLEVVAELTSVRLTGDGGALLHLGTLGDIVPAAITQFKGRSAAANS